MFNVLSAHKGNFKKKTQGKAECLNWIGSNWQKISIYILI